MAQEKKVPSIRWQLAMGGTSEDAWMSICPAREGGMVICGYSSSTDGDLELGHGNVDAWVMKLSAGGTLVWKKQYGGSRVDFANSIAPAGDGGYVVAGVTYSDDGDFKGNKGLSDAWVMKISASGDIEWSRLYGGSGYEEAVSVHTSAEGGFLVVGGSSSSDGDLNWNNGLYDGWAFRIRNDGSLVWQQAMGGWANDYFYHVVQRTDGGWIIAGTSDSDDGDVYGNAGGGDAWLVALSGGGRREWSRLYGGPGMDRFFSVNLLPGGGILASGYCGENGGMVLGNNGALDAWLVEIGQDGKLVKQVCYGGGEQDYLVGSSLAGDGGVILCGTTYSEIEGVDGSVEMGGGWVLKVDASLQKEWQYAGGGSDHDQWVDVLPVADQQYVLVGASGSADGGVGADHGMLDGWVVSLNSGVSTGLEMQELKRGWSVFPNPARSRVEIREMGQLLQFKQLSRVDVYASDGRLIRSFDGLRVGDPILLSGISPGLYWVVVNEKGFEKKAIRLVIE